MAEASAQLHESSNDLGPDTVDRHRAIVSIMEEFEAVDWYDQRLEATDDDELRAILAHNRDEEKEHAAMTLEWLRRHDPQLDEELRTYLWNPEALAGELRESSEEPGEVEGITAQIEGGSLGIGSLRGEIQP